ncbi:S8 family serine peptidase [Propionibacteriaceae bacterium Y2011]
MPAASQPTLRRRRLGAVLAVLGFIAALIVPAAPAHALEDYTPEACQTYLSQAAPGEAWHMKRLRYDDVHRIATGKGVTIAVIDTGVFQGSSQYMAGINLDWDNTTGVDKAKDDRVDCGHGTFVVSLIAGQNVPDLDYDYSGIAPDVNILAIRALQETSPREPEPLGPVIEAIDKAVAAKVDIISISQSGSDTPQYRAAIERAVAAGILVVAASGNGGAAGPSYPANYPGVMAVAMTTATDVPDPQSQYGEGMQISVAAPGSGVVGMKPLCLSSDPNCPPGQGPSYFEVDTGTSFATPLVAGAAALLMERYPDMTAKEVRRRLEVTADPPVGGAPDLQLGNGIINPYRALTAPVGPPAPSGAETQPGNLHIQPPPVDTNHAARNTALAVAGTSLGIVTIAGVIAAALPAGRKRRWRPARHD